VADFLRGVFGLVGELQRSRRRCNSGKQRAACQRQKPRLHIKLVAQLELLRNGLVTADVFALQIFEQAAALTNHHQQPATGAVIFFVGLQMFRQMVDPLREQRDLDVGRTGVFNMQLRAEHHSYSQCPCKVFLNGHFDAKKPAFFTSENPFYSPQEGD
jgi:hypothetical protein